MMSKWVGFYSTRLSKQVDLTRPDYKTGWGRVEHFNPISTQQHV